MQVHKIVNFGLYLSLLHYGIFNPRRSPVYIDVIILHVLENDVTFRLQSVMLNGFKIWDH